MHHTQNSCRYCRLSTSHKCSATITLNFINSKLSLVDRFLYLPNHKPDTFDKVRGWELHLHGIFGIFCDGFLYHVFPSCVQPSFFLLKRKSGINITKQSLSYCIVWSVLWKPYVVVGTQTRPPPAISMGTNLEWLTPRDQQDIWGNPLSKLCLIRGGLAPLLVCQNL